jgi:hypothetical protein
LRKQTKVERNENVKRNGVNACTTGTALSSNTYLETVRNGRDTGVPYAIVVQEKFGERRMFTQSETNGRGCFVPE